MARALAKLDPAELGTEYREFLHSNEIVLLAYYVGAINIEQTYHMLRGAGPYEPFPGIVFADTFQMGEGHDELWPEFLRPNSERARSQQSLPITVVIGNPPYSVGQASQNDNNRNLVYPRLDQRIDTTYAARSSANLKRNLYDSRAARSSVRATELRLRSPCLCAIQNRSVRPASPTTTSATISAATRS